MKPDSKNVFLRNLSLIRWVSLITCLFLVSSCSNAQENIEKDKILIVYLTRTKNTIAIAEMIQKKVGGELVALELEKPYPEDYKAIVEQVSQENASGYLPPLKTKVENIKQFKTVFVGFPTWGMQMPPPMKSFLSENDLSGITVIPFNTNAGYGVGSGFKTVEELCPKSNVLEGFSMKGGIERDGILFVMEGEKAQEADKKVVTC